MKRTDPATLEEQLTDEQRTSFLALHRLIFTDDLIDALRELFDVIAVLRLVGARDIYIAGAFVRRFTLRALIGAGIGVALGMAGVMLLPAASEEGGFLTGLGFRGAGWLWPLLVPPLGALVAFGATWAAARRRLKELS